MGGKETDQTKEIVKKEVQIVKLNKFIWVEVTIRNIADLIEPKALSMI